MATSLNEIYTAIGTLTARVEGLRQDIQENEARNVESNRKADESRANVHRRLDDIVMRTTHLETDVVTVKSQVSDMRQVTDGVKELRQRAQGAGTLGYWLIRIGIGVVALAGWLVGLYTWLTGKPPP